MTTERIDIIVSERGSRVVKRNLEDIGGGSAAAAQGVQFLTRTLVALGGALAVRDILAQADAYTTIINRLKLVTSGTENLSRINNELFASAQRTRVSYEATVDLYSRVARNADALGLSQDRLLAITETVNQAIRVSGATAQEAGAGVRQLGQALGSGALRGDELISVLENMPRLAQAIADGLGVTIGELRELGAAGELTSDKIVGALEASADGIAQEFSQLAPTIGEAFQVLGDSALRFIGEMDQALGASEALANGLLLLADNIDIVANGVVFLGTALSVAFAAGLIAKVRAMGGAMQVLAVAVRLLGGPLSILLGLLTAFGPTLIGYINGTAQAETAVDNLTLAIFDEITAAGNLVTAMQGQQTLSLNVAQAKLREALSRRENIQAMVAERNEAVTNTSEFRELQRQIDEVQFRLESFTLTPRAGAGGVGDLFPLEEAFRLQELMLDLQAAQQRMLGLRSEEAQEVENLNALIEALNSAIADSEDGVVDLNFMLENGFQLTERLVSSAGAVGGNLSNAALQASNLARNLVAAANALSAIAGATANLDVQTVGLNAANQALASGADALDARAAQQLAERRAELAPALGSEDAIIRGAARAELEAYTEALGSNTEAARANQELIAQLNATTSGGSSGSSSGGSGVSAEQEAINEELERRVRILDDIRGATVSYEADLASLNALVESGTITAQEYAGAWREVRVAFLDSQNTFEAGLERGFLRVQSDLEDVGSSIEETFTNAFSSAEDALVEFVKTGKLDFKGFVASILEDIVRLNIRQNILAPLNNLLGDLLGFEASTGAGGAGDASGAVALSGSATALTGSATALTGAATALSTAGAVQGTGLNFAATQIGTATSAASATAQTVGEIPGQLNNFSGTFLGGIGSWLSSFASVFSGGGAGGGGLFSSLLGGIFGGLGGGGAPKIGLATGGDFTVSGKGGVDSQLVSFRASPGERVKVTRPGESESTTGGSPVTMIIQTPDAESFRRSETQIAARMARMQQRGRRNL